MAVNLQKWFQINLSVDVLVSSAGGFLVLPLVGMRIYPKADYFRFAFESWLVQGLYDIQPAYATGGT